MSFSVVIYKWFLTSARSFSFASSGSVDFVFRDKFTGFGELPQPSVVSLSSASSSSSSFISPSSFSSSSVSRFTNTAGALSSFSEFVHVLPPSSDCFLASSLLEDCHTSDLICNNSNNSWMLSNSLLCGKFPCWEILQIKTFFTVYLNTRLSVVQEIQQVSQVATFYSRYQHDAGPVSVDAFSKYSTH